MNSYKILLCTSFLSLFCISNLQAQIDTTALFNLDDKPLEYQKGTWMFRLNKGLSQEEAPIKSISLSGKVFDCSTDNHEEIPFANIVLLSASDTTDIVQGGTTDLQGNYHFESLKKDNYILKASYIGYKPFEMQLDLIGVREKKVIRDVPLQQEPVALNEIVIKGKRSIRGIDKTTFSFSEQQIKKAS